MGYCGWSQLAAGPYPLGSHGLCPHLYNFAFTTEFVPTNYYKCTSARLAKNLTTNVRMGYMGDFNRFNTTHNFEQDFINFFSEHSFKVTSSLQLQDIQIISLSTTRLKIKDLFDFLHHELVAVTAEK